MMTVSIGRTIIVAQPDDTVNIIDLFVGDRSGDQAHRQAAQTCMKACIESIGIACQTNAEWLDYRPDEIPTSGRFYF